MKKSKKIIMLLSILLIAFTFCIGGYSYAKYKTVLKGGGEVDIAKWSFIVNGNTEQLETITLSETGVDESLLVNGKIAPGTRGSFSIEIDGTGTEVGIDYEIRFSNEQNKPTNLVFYYENQEYKSLSELYYILGQINVDEEEKVKTITIDWEWKYETGNESEIEYNDLVDTQEGIQNLDYTFDVIVKGTQIPYIVQ